MKIKVGDTIHYSLKANKYDRAVVRVRASTVVEITEYETGYGTYEEYKVNNGDWVSELELVD